MNQFNKAMGGWVALMRKINIVAQTRYTVLLPFACAMMVLPVPGDAKDLREAYRLYDKNGVAFTPITDLRKVLVDQLTEEELDELIAEIDSDGSGPVDHDGFMKIMIDE